MRPSFIPDDEDAQASNLGPVESLTPSAIEIRLDAFSNPVIFDEPLALVDDMVPRVTREPASPRDDDIQPDPTIAADNIMDIPILKLLQCFANTAQAMGCMELLFSHDPTVLWTMPCRTIPNLPENMQPTPAQISIPHHPIFDILPWPSVRSKLIFAFSLPEQQRPVIAKSATALIQLAYDVEDETDGFRLNGSGNTVDEWEVGQLFYKNW